MKVDIRLSAFRLSISELIIKGFLAHFGVPRTRFYYVLASINFQRYRSTEVKLKKPLILLMYKAHILNPCTRCEQRQGSNLYRIRTWAAYMRAFSFEYSVQIKKSRDNECPHSFIREMLTAFLLSHQQ
jgi:hypothetical protein